VIIFLISGIMVVDHVSIVDQSGKIIFHSAQTKATPNLFDITTLRPGEYWVKIEGKAGTTLKRFLKKR
jgi:hypothetical protein